MQISVFARVAGLACASLPTLAHAGEAAPDTSFTVGEIVVTARGMAGSGSPLTSVDRLGGEVAQGAEVRNAYELVARMPGIQLTEFNQGTTSGKFSLRGFNGEGNINAVKLLIDGVPSNANDGNMPYIDMIFPLGIAGIEVVRGTADARYGLHAIAGSATIQTRAGGTYLDGKASAGSFGTFEGQLAAGLERGGFVQNYALGWRDADGYRAHGHSRRLGLSGRWGLALGDVVKLGAVARWYDASAEEPGYLTHADSRANPRMTNAYNASDGDTRRMQQYALSAEATFAERLDWTARAWANRLDDDRYVKFSAGAAQQRRLTEEDHHGLSTALHWHGALAAMPLMLEAGANVEWQDNRSARWTAVNRVPTAQTRDQRFGLSVGGAYLQAALEPAGWLRIAPAYRIDWVGGDFTNRLSGATARVNRYGAIAQPKLSVAVLPTGSVTLYGNWGRTFQIGVGSATFLASPTQADLAPSINEGWEAGVKYALGRTGEARLAWWEQRSSGEFARKLNDPNGDSENVGATRRRGLDLQVGAKLRAGLSAWASASWQEAIIVRPPAATPGYAGNELDHAPHWLWSGGVDWMPGERLTLSLSGRGQSSYFLTGANAEGRWGQARVFDLGATFRPDPAVELGLALRNLADAYSEYVWWDGAQTLHSPAPGRSVTISLRLRR